MEKKTVCDFCGERPATTSCDVCGASICSVDDLSYGCKVCNGGKRTFE